MIRSTGSRPGGLRALLMVLALCSLLACDAACGRKGRRARDRDRGGKSAMKDDARGGRDGGGKAVVDQGGKADGEGKASTRGSKTKGTPARKTTTTRPADTSDETADGGEGVADAGRTGEGEGLLVDEADAEAWWPSEWGPDDQRGAANRVTPERVVKAAGLIREGTVYQLGHTYEYDMPLVGKRHFSLTIPGSPSGGPEGENGLVYHDEVFSGELGQIGTQFDGLGHVGARRADGEDYYYNGFKGSDFSRARGLEKLGVEHAGVFYTRGVLLDVAARRGVERMEAGDVITAEDLEATAEAQGVEVGEGDTVLIHTGHGRLWIKDNAAYSKGEPGIGIGAARWLAERKVVLVGADNWAVEVVPFENPRRPYVCHQELLTRNGIYLLENLDLTRLAADGVYEFAFIFAPVPMKGGTGSPGNPIAVK